MNPILSILTPTIHERLFDQFDCVGSVEGLVQDIDRQIGNLPVEHLMLFDNRRRSIGAKRQSLLDIARGEYIAFVDDDDDVSDDYVSSILAAAASGADCITFNQRAIYNKLESEVHFGVKNEDCQFMPGGITLRGPWHVCAWKRALVRDCLFAESNYGEDMVWCEQARRRIRTGIHIPRVLHIYRHDAATTAAPENRLSAAGG